MEMALGRQRVLVLRVLNRPACPVYDGAVAEKLHQRRELQRFLEREQIAHQRMAASAMAWRNGLY
ncbi:MAG TPA: hypothetical protein VNE17_02855 [Nitrolancea sp.]|nr:hypothetical protein [Nitrolancea sp.]